MELLPNFELVFGQRKMAMGRALSLKFSHWRHNKIEVSKLKNKLPFIRWMRTKRKAHVQDSLHEKFYRVVETYINLLDASNMNPNRMKSLQHETDQILYVFPRLSLRM